MDETHSGVAANDGSTDAQVKTELLVLTETQHLNFWNKVDKSHPGGCWIWTAAKIPKGYGYFSIRRKATYVHRLSYQMHKGPIPDGVNVCHNCPSGDNPSCVNPNHLWLGTQKENLDDMVSKGRDNKARGDDSGPRKHPEVWATKITRDIALSILSAPEHNAALARKYNVSQSTISEIRLGKTWKHLPRPEKPSSCSSG